MGEASGLGKADVSLAQSGEDGASATATPLARPEGVALDRSRSRLFVADTGNGLVRYADEATGIMRTVAGSLASATAPSATPTPATEVALQRPVGLAVDSQNNELFVADRGRGELLRVQMDPDPDVLSVVLGGTDVERPSTVGFHDFRFGPRILFALDLGGEGTTQATPRPALRVVDLDASPVAHTTIGAGAGCDFRILYDFCLRELATGEVELYVAADVGDDFEEYTYGGAPNIEDMFEVDCHDGLDNDGDGKYDSDDPDCREPLNFRVLRFRFSANGPGVATGVPIPCSPEILVRCHKKFPVVGINSMSCGSHGAGVSQVEFPGLVVEAITVDADGRLYFVNSFDGTIEFVDFDASSGIAAQGVLVGSSSLLARPFDGQDPRVTRMNRPRDFLIDRWNNLYIADTVHNRIRRTWVGGIMQSQ
ncbi:MAG: hypothetical protein AAF628_33495 [Planctomycetota bacterium]